MKLYRNLGISWMLLWAGATWWEAKEFFPVLLMMMLLLPQFIFGFFYGLNK